MYSTVNASSLVFNLCTALCLSQKVFTLVFKYFYHTGNNQVGSVRLNTINALKFFADYAFAIDGQSLSTHAPVQT